MKRTAYVVIDEVITLCKKYDGLLCREEASLSLQEEITEYEAVVKSKMAITLESAHLCYENTPILFYNNRFLFNKTQLKLYFKEEQKELKQGDCLCLILFDYSATTKEFTFTHVCPIDKLKWNLASIILQHYKVFHLGRDIVQLSLDSNQEHLFSNEEPCFEIKIEEEEGEEMIISDEFETKEERSFWLPDCVAENEIEPKQEENTAFNQYIQLLIDNRLIRCHFERGPTRKDHFQYYTKLVSLKEQREMTGLFVYYSMRISFETRVKRLLEEDDEEKLLSLEDIAKEQAFQLWLEAESHLFIQAKTNPAFKQKLEEHVSFLCLNLPSQLIPPWFDYTVQKNEYIEKEGRSRDFWIFTREKKYKIRMEWLFRPEFSLFIAKSYPQIEGGYVFIDQNVFYSVFIPCVYRQTLADTILWFYCSTKRIKENGPLSKFNSLSEKYGDRTKIENLCRDLSILDLDNPQNLIEYCETNGDPASFVLQNFKELSKTKGREVLRSSGSFAVTFEPFYRKNMSDLEDLFKSDILPPCLKSVLSPEHRGKMGNQDRLNSIRYLKGMDYADEEILSFLNTNDVTTYAHDLVAIMKTYNNKPKGEDKGPLGCASIINLKHDSKNVFRCAYEQKKNGDKQIFYATFQEKQPFIIDCCNAHFSTLPSVEMKHPFQFVRMKINK